MAIYFIVTQELSICAHARSIFTRTLSTARYILSIAVSLQLGRKKNCDGTMKASSVLIFPLCLKKSKYRFRQLFEHKNY